MVRLTKIFLILQLVFLSGSTTTATRFGEHQHRRQQQKKEEEDSSSKAIVAASPSGYVAGAVVHAGRRVQEYILAGAAAVAVGVVGIGGAAVLAACLAEVIPIEECEKKDEDDGDGDGDGNGEDDIIFGSDGIFGFLKKDEDDGDGDGSPDMSPDISGDEGKKKGKRNRFLRVLDFEDESEEEYEQ